jgi:hypothetical protein
MRKENIITIFLLTLFSQQMPGEKLFIRIHQLLAAVGRRVTIACNSILDEESTMYCFSLGTPIDLQGPETGEGLVEVTNPLRII